MSQAIACPIVRHQLKTGLALLGSRAPAQGPTALIYHRVGGDSPDERDVPTKTFAEQVQLLREAPVIPLATRPWTGARMVTPGQASF